VRLGLNQSGSGDWLDVRSKVFARRYGLSPREQQILLLLVRGVRQKEISGVVGCAYSSVRTYVSRMSTKLSCSGTTELVLRFFNEPALTSSRENEANASP